ncbi:MAG: hypothetical protein LWY06_01995 [Firmicutes bacterium]|nr:hypothetical protein [Bacillota bacterium]
MKKNGSRFPVIFFIVIALMTFMWSCAGSKGDDGGGVSPSPTYTPIADFYNLVIVESEKTVRCGVTSNSDLTGDFQVAPPEMRNYTMDTFPVNLKIADYYYGAQAEHATGVSDHTLETPKSIKYYLDFPSSMGLDNPKGLYTFVNNGDFNNITGDFDYPSQINIESPSESEEIQTGKSFKVKWNSDEGEYRYFVVVEYAEADDTGTLPVVWSSDDFRNLNWADPNSIYYFMVSKTTTDKEVYVPAAIFTSQGAVNITVYGFLPDKFVYGADSDAGKEIMIMGKKTIRVKMVP